MTALPINEHTSGIAEARKAAAASRARSISADKLIAKNKGILALLGEAHAGPDYFAEELRKTIRGIR
jgi:hypothetical protein